MNYADITLNDPNGIKRYLQRSRFNSALKLYPTSAEALTVLDFGAGDGELALRLNTIASSSNYICYEPTPHMYKQAEKRLDQSNNVKLVNTLTTIEDNSLDIVYSLEVFEHLPQAESAEAFSKIYDLLKPGGKLIVGVPNELYFPALYKGLFRMTRRLGQFDAQLKNILRCFFAKPPQKRPICEISQGMNYHPHHLGFDHRKLKKQLQKSFLCSKQVASPFPILGTLFNPEVYFVMQKNEEK